MKINGVVFDLDHTLFDRYKTLEAIKDIVHDGLKEYLNPHVASEMFIQELCDSDRRKVVYGWKAIFEDMCKKNIFSKIPDFENYSLAIRKGFLAKAVPYTFAVPVLNYIKNLGLKTAIVTNGKPLLQWNKIDMLKLRPHMDAIVVSGDIGIHKPEAAPFLEAAKLLGEAPETLLYVGDHPVNDIEGSRNAGFIPVWVKTYGVWIDGIKKADYEVLSIEQLPGLLDTLLG